MRFYNMEKIIENIDVKNKYLLTSIVAHRARQISETKGRNVLDKGAEEKYISMALADMEAGRVAVTLQNDNIPDVIESEVNLNENEETENPEDLSKAAAFEETSDRAGTKEETAPESNADDETEPQA